MITIAKNENISELSKLRVLQQQEDYGEKYPDNDDEVYNTTKKYLEEHLNKDIYFLLEIIDGKIVGTLGLQINLHLIFQKQEEYMKNRGL